MLKHDPFCLHLQLSQILISLGIFLNPGEMTIAVIYATRQLHVSSGREISSSELERLSRLNEILAMEIKRRSGRG